MKKHFLLCALGFLLLSSSCQMMGVRGNGHVVSKDFSNADFKKIDVSSEIKVYLTQGNNYAIKIDAEDNILDLIQVKNNNGKLSIGIKNNVAINPTKDVIVHITAPDFQELDASGASSYISVGNIKTSVIYMDLSGASEVALDLNVGDLRIDASGASKIKLQGNAGTFKMEGSGSTNVEAFDLITQQSDIQISGAGDAKVNATKVLNVNITGAGSVIYKGNPAITKDISGAGSIKSAN